MARCSETVKDHAYCAVVRPHLEYVSSASDPYLKNDINQPEGVQRRVARFIQNDYRRESVTVTAMHEDLNWLTQEKRRQMQRRVLFHMVLQTNTYIAIPPYLHVKSRETQVHLPWTMREWNTLPTSLESVGNSMVF